MWESTLCPGGCGHTIDKAWHTDSDGWFEVERFKCYACTERADDDRDVVYHQVVSTRSPDDPPLTPFELGVTTFAPEPTPNE